MVRIADRAIGPGEPCFLIAEAGVNHNGRVELARALVDAAAAAGADAIKFQAFRAEAVAAPEAPMAEYQSQGMDGFGSQLDLLRSLELAVDSYGELKRRAEEQGLVFLASVFDLSSVDLLDRLDVAAFKIGSGELTNHQLLHDVGLRRRPVILSSGAAYLEEVAAAVEVLRAAGGTQLAVLHCVSAYPAAVEDSNLSAMSTLAEKLRVPVGFSDHTQGDEAALAAVALGACILEKHFTLDRSLPGPDQQASLEPDDLADLIRRVRRVESALGDGIKAPSDTERANAAVIRRSLAASTDLPKGTVLVPAMVMSLRPGTGIPPARLDEIVGRRLRRAVAHHQLLHPDDFE